MGGTGSQPGCELHLRSMSLINLQPAHPSNASSGASLAATALGNFSSMLWFFGIDRMSSLYPQNSANRTSDRLGSIVLYDVAVMVSSYELQIIRALITNSTGLQNLLSNDAIQLIRQQIHAANYSMGSKGNTLLLEGDISLSTPSSNYSGGASTSVSTIPGDILFSTFNWFGIKGRNVIFTASNNTISSDATFSSFFPKKDPKGSPIFADTSHPYPEPSALMVSLPSSLLSSLSPSASLGQWQLALVISLPLAGALAIMAAVTAWLRHSRQRLRDPIKVC